LREEHKSKKKVILDRKRAINEAYYTQGILPPVKDLETEAKDKAVTKS
jgi:hypothetical protein